MIKGVKCITHFLTAKLLDFYKNDNKKMLVYTKKREKV